MTSLDYIRTGTAEDAVSSLELAAEFFEQAKLDERYWKWFIVALHAGIQGTFVLALEGSDGLLVQKPGVMKATLSADRTGNVPPQQYMDNLLKLYKKLQRPEYLRSVNSQPIAASQKHECALSSLDSLRNEFLHFNAKSLSIERELVIVRARESLEVAMFLLAESRSILWREHSHEERAKAAITRLCCALHQES